MRCNINNIFKYNIIETRLEEKKISVRIMTPLGEFLGVSKIHPEEKEEHVSVSFGKTIAEYRAIIKYINRMINYNNFAYNNLSYVLNSGKKTKPLMDNMYRLKKENEELIKQKKQINDMIEFRINSRNNSVDEIRKKLNK